MTDQEMKSVLKRLYVKALRTDAAPDDLPDTSLVSFLHIDSISSLEVLILVEQEFDIEFDDADLDVRLIDSLDVLIANIRKRAAAGAGATP